ncbi:2OG-Fe(II) oxygenase [Sphingomonas corticis]|jgi:Rps23 Pro-64 3,4-dihydroxylase Tpa1-like proline 4-hydroxylase|uniref:Proline hydroxylase n=1 Tax=Sphingomonas corticis TaxID=2722791 RepID=A0ABX1CL42_9SPHN|nr:2OG-Fe(II) oxygenase family protein [Sphingomonas corticis]NJR78705.1 proline hydroxylase [Sphingomonas corticis]
MSTLPPLSLNPALDATALARRFAIDGRVQIADFLPPEVADAWHAMLRGRGDWVQVVNSGDKLFELSREVRAGMAAAQREALDQAVYAGARDGFQFRYEAIRVPDVAEARRGSDDPLAALARFLSEGDARDFLRTVTGEARIDFADAQATAFSPGDFLTGHDDAVTGKKRHAAYVLGLTPVWRTEWGGLLLFHDGRRIADGFVPALGTLNLFRVPQRHSVTEVTRAAAYRRYSVTGWLRAR